MALLDVLSQARVGSSGVEDKETCSKFKPSAFQIRSFRASFLRTAANETNEIEERSEDGQIDDVEHVVDDASSDEDDRQLGQKNAGHAGNGSQNDGD